MEYFSRELDIDYEIVSKKIMMVLKKNMKYLIFRENFREFLFMGLR